MVLVWLKRSGEVKVEGAVETLACGDTRSQDDHQRQQQQVCNGVGLSL